MRHAVIDTETTGMDEKDTLVELAAVLDDGTVWETLCDPGRPIPPEARAVHHISDAMVKGFPEPSIALVRMMRHLDAVLGSDMVFVAHNAQFDRGMLRKLVPDIDARHWICTYRCAMHVWDNAPGHSNQVLRYWLNLPVVPPITLAPHRAAYDAIITEGILRELLKVKSYDDLIRMTAEPVILTKVRFGKYKGYLWADVPRDYLQWAAKQQDMDADVRHTVAHHLRGNGRLL